MADPVLASDGYTYERQSIQQHWDNQLEGGECTAAFVEKSWSNFDTVKRRKLSNSISKKYPDADR